MERSLNLFLEKLDGRTRLTPDERQAILSLAGKPERIGARKTFAPPGGAMNCACLVVEGFCAWVEMPAAGKRQITAIYVEGDMPDLYSAFLPDAPAMIEALAPATIMRIPHAQIRDVMRDYPGVSEAFARYLVGDAAITMQWLANVGSRDAKSSIAHLFCEIAVRLGKARDDGFSFFFPISQLQLSEACGLSQVHVNRSLMSLRHEGLMLIERGIVRVPDWHALRKVAGFDGRYLQAGRQMRFAA